MNIMEEEKSCAARVQKTKGRFSFSLTGWSDVPNRVGESTESPEFEICGKLWQLRIFPGGSLEAHSGYISYYLASKDTTVTRASYKLSIVNQIDDEPDAVFLSSGVRKFEAKGVQVDGWGRDKFIEKHRVNNPSNGLCIDDTVIFKVEITVIGGLTPITKNSCVTGTPITSLSTSLLKAMGNANETFADLTIHFGGANSIKVHKCILCARSPVFHAMLNTPMKECLSNVVEIQDADYGVMLELIKFIYSDIISDFNILDSILYELYATASKYQVKGLVCICENRILETLVSTTAIDALRVTDAIGNTKKMKEQIMLYVTQHFKEVCTSDGYQRLVDSTETDEHASVLLEELHCEVCNSTTDMHCLRLMSNLLQHHPKLIKLDKMTTGDDIDFAKVNRNGCNIM